MEISSAETMESTSSSRSSPPTTRELLPPLPSRESSLTWALEEEPSEAASEISDNAKAPSKMEAAAARMELRAKKSMRMRKCKEDLLLSEENSRASLAESDPGDWPANNAPSQGRIKDQDNETNVKYMLASNLQHGMRVDFVSQMNDAAKVIQREWRARKKRRYWEALDKALGQGEGMMQRNAWGGFTMVTDPFVVEEDGKENFCLMEEYYSGSEYDELSGSDDDLLELLEADLETAAAELVHCGEEQTSLEEVEKAARKFARKRKRLQLRDKLLSKGLLPEPGKRKKPPRKVLRHMKKEAETKKKEARNAKLLGGGKSQRRSLDVPRPKTQDQEQNRRKSMDEPRVRSPRTTPGSGSDVKPNPPSSPKKSPLSLPNITRRPFKPKPPPVDPIPGDWSRPVLESPHEDKRSHDFLKRRGGVERPKASILAKVEGEKESEDVVAQLKEEIHELKAEIKRLAPSQVKPFKVAEFENWTTLMKWRFALLTHSVLQLKSFTKQKDKVFDKETQAKLAEWAHQSPVEALEEVAMEVHRSGGGSRRRLLRKFDMLAITRAVAKFHTWLGNLEDLLVVGTKPGSDTPVQSPIPQRVTVPAVPSNSERRAEMHDKRMMTGFESTERLRTPRVGAVMGYSALPSQLATPISTAVREPCRIADDTAEPALEKTDPWKHCNPTPRLPAMGTRHIQRRPHSMEKHVRESRKVDWQTNKAKFHRYGPRPPPRLIVSSNSSDMLPVAFTPILTPPATLPSRQTKRYSVAGRRSFDGSRPERNRSMRSSML